MIRSTRRTIRALDGLKGQISLLRLRNRTELMHAYRLMPSSHTMPQPSDFAALASDLRKIARGRYMTKGHQPWIVDGHTVSVGPLRIRIHIDRQLAHLLLTEPFYSVESYQAANVEGSDESVFGSTQTSSEPFDIFVLLDDGNRLDSITTMLNAPTAQAFSEAKRSSCHQLVLKAIERKQLRTFDVTNRVALLYITDLSLLPSWERFSPIKELIHLYALTESCLLFHGASLAQSDSSGCVLIVGPGGAGKSSLTALALSQGMKTTGDDYVLVDLRRSEPWCWSVYRTLKLHPTSPSAGLLRSQSEGRPVSLNVDSLSETEPGRDWQQAIKPWQADPLTNKTIWLWENADIGQGSACFLATSVIRGVYGVSLNQAKGCRLLETPSNENESAQVASPVKPWLTGRSVTASEHPYLYSCMSTIQQIPYWVDRTLALTKQLHDAVGYQALNIGDGLDGTKTALETIQSDLSQHVALGVAAKLTCTVPSQSCAPSAADANE